MTMIPKPGKPPNEIPSYRLQIVVIEKKTYSHHISLASEKDIPL